MIPRHFEIEFLLIHVTITDLVDPQHLFFFQFLLVDLPSINRAEVTNYKVTVIDIYVPNTRILCKN